MRRAKGKKTQPIPVQNLVSAKARNRTGQVVKIVATTTAAVTGAYDTLLGAYLVHHIKLLLLGKKKLLAHF